MLVLSRKQNETIVIGDNIRVTVFGVSRGKVSIGIDAPKGVSVHREEIYRVLKGIDKPDR